MNQPVFTLFQSFRISSPLCIRIIFIFLFPAYTSIVLANTSTVEVSGSFNSTNNKFAGKAVFLLKPVKSEKILFHLPPVWYAENDGRVEYELRLDDSQYKVVSRNDLMPIEPPINKNIHLPQGIQINIVTVNGKLSPFQVIDNPKLLPLKNSKQALLSIPVKHQTNLSPISIEIDFITQFNPLSSGLRRLLWDFIPRPVGYYDGVWDFRSVVPPTLRQTLRIVRINEEENTEVAFHDQNESPFSCLLLDRWDYRSERLKLSYDSYFDDSRKRLMFRIYHVVAFLEQYQLLQSRQEDLELILWDGPLTVSGMTILLPRRLFRYPNIFYKQFEITLLNGIVKALLFKRFLIDANRLPWILPAVQSEVVRRYFSERFKGNTFIFPWLDWINPEYFSDTSVRRWVETLYQKDITAADVPVDVSYYAHIFHPGFEKGFHLFWMLHDGQPDYRNRLTNTIFNLLNEQSGKRVPFSKNDFFRLFTESAKIQKLGEKWLSSEGRVDYAIKNVDVSKVAGRYLTRLEIVNHGSIAPVLEISFSFEGESTIIRQVKGGGGQYEFFFDRQPTQIILDPSFNILDDNPVNNSWQFPFRTRLIWDFASPDYWLFTVSPLVGEGNTFDRNILGLNLSTSYLTRTLFQLNFWKGSSDSLLWSGEFSHTGYPFLGTQLYLKSGYLGAVSSTSVGINQTIFRGYPDFWVDISLWKETLDDIDDSEFTEDQLEWAGITLSSQFPVFEYALHLWQVELMARTGRGMFEPVGKYRQLKIEQFFRYNIGSADIHLGYNHGFSSGSVPLQRRYPMGGTEGLSGFPRTKDLLFYENNIIEMGMTLPGVLTNTDINLLGLMWLNGIVPTLDFHYGQGVSNDGETEEFSDVELSFSLFGEFINRFEGIGRFAVAQPLGHEKYKDYRIILFSSWVF